MVHIRIKRHVLKPGTAIRNSPGQHRTVRKMHGIARNTHGTVRNTRGTAQNTYGTAQNTCGTAYSSCLFILNGGIYFTNNEIASELLNYIINQVQSSHDIKWTELTLMLTGQLQKHDAKKLCLSFSPTDM